MRTNCCRTKSLQSNTTPRKQSARSSRKNEIERQAKNTEIDAKLCSLTFEDWKLWLHGKRVSIQFKQSHHVACDLPLFHKLGVGVTNDLRKADVVVAGTLDLTSLPYKYQWAIALKGLLSHNNGILHTQRINLKIHTSLADQKEDIDVSATLHIQDCIPKICATVAYVVWVLQLAILLR